MSITRKLGFWIFAPGLLVLFLTFGVVDTALENMITQKVNTVVMNQLQSQGKILNDIARNEFKVLFFEYGDQPDEFLLRLNAVQKEALHQIKSSVESQRYMGIELYENDKPLFIFKPQGFMKNDELVAHYHFPPWNWQLTVWYNDALYRQTIRESLKEVLLAISLGALFLGALFAIYALNDR